MAFTERSIRDADLIVPLAKCPLGEPVGDCPFTIYWNSMNHAKRIALVDELAEEKLDELRAFHKKCLAIKIEQARDESTRYYQNLKK